MCRFPGWPCWWPNPSKTNKQQASCFWSDPCEHHCDIQLHSRFEPLQNNYEVLLLVHLWSFHLLLYYANVIPHPTLLDLSVTWGGALLRFVCTSALWHSCTCIPCIRCMWSSYCEINLSQPQGVRDWERPNKFPKEWVKFETKRQPLFLERNSEALPPSDSLQATAWIGWWEGEISDWLHEQVECRCVFLISWPVSLFKMLVRSCAEYVDAGLKNLWMKEQLDK